MVDVNACLLLRNQYNNIGVAWANLGVGGWPSRLHGESERRDKYTGDHCI